MEQHEIEWYYPNYDHRIGNEDYSLFNLAPKDFEYKDPDLTPERCELITKAIKNGKSDLEIAFMLYFPSAKIYISW